MWAVWQTVWKRLTDTDCLEDRGDKCQLPAQVAKSLKAVVTRVRYEAADCRLKRPSDGLLKSVTDTY